MRIIKIYKKSSEKIADTIETKSKTAINNKILEEEVKDLTENEIINLLNDKKNKFILDFLRGRGLIYNSLI